MKDKAAEERRALIKKDIKLRREKLSKNLKNGLRREVAMLLTMGLGVETFDVANDTVFFIKKREFYADNGMGTSFTLFFVLSVIVFAANLALCCWILRSIYLEYTVGTETLHSKRDDEIFSTEGRERNPVAERSKLAREIKLLVMKIVAIASVEDIPTLYFKVQLFLLKEDKLDGYELGQLVVSAFMLGYIITKFHLLLEKKQQRDKLGEEVDKSKAITRHQRTFKISR